MKILLHTCCAPCLIYPLRKLRKDGTEVTGFFYNPNIYPLFEYKDRRKALVNLSSMEDIDIIYPEYFESVFIETLNKISHKPERCFLCWRLRLGKTAQYAKRHGFYGFSTTLLVSPYQDQEALKKIGQEISEKEGIYFYYEDFRRGFAKAYVEAQGMGLYLQNYCGCRYSASERKNKDY